MVYEHLWGESELKRPLRIGLIAEGKTELGFSVAPPIIAQDGGHPIPSEQEGALHTLIRRELVEAGFPNCQFVQRHPSTKEWKNREFRTGHTILDRKYVAQAVIAWKSHEIDMVVICADSDDQVDGRSASLQGAMMTARANHLDIHEKPIPDRSAGGLAIKNFETWLLADNQAVVALLAVSLPELPANLETLPGDRENEECARFVLDRAIEESAYRLEDTKREFRIRWELAGVVELAQIKAHCQQGYVVFADALQAAAGAVIASQQDS
ncbi:MAG: hypothetical protein AB1791_10470 [Chloroflexota bacterium]